MFEILQDLGTQGYIFLEKKTKEVIITLANLKNTTVYRSLFSVVCMLSFSSNIA
jgi:hypothetical protein